ncbi:pyridoxal phosphate-dependent aminotransferase [Tropicimonas sp. IMCC6043]|uniref:pyridoxal phosphate-dependent aminotransferase n=1 Tax=Tropicimonas sp. IMCC6043 TaxID=2510645 RepID=UPI00101B6FE8|nr:pyridoxal phosphate-dependent aminotransferase [Tropicimonas sp. IMCC6043]RYH05971.1 aminotransferase class I/II-fold pyridoxal phosphate-dependent enzyme [Tropicimonas sp. IMCC6043]
MSILEKFEQLATDNAPGQEGRQSSADTDSFLKGAPLAGRPVDFSHGDVNAHPPTPGALGTFVDGYERGGAQAYTEYRGDAGIRHALAIRLADFTGATVDGADGLIVTPGTQGALFLAVAATVGAGDKIAIVQPDYFANRKLAVFLGAEIHPVQLRYGEQASGTAGIDLEELEIAFRAGVKTFLFSNPNNPTGVVYSEEEIGQIAALATRYGATVIVDQLYSRLCYEWGRYTHLRAADVDSEKVVTIMGPSKTESLSGFRLGVAFGARAIISRMEQLQAIVSLRASGYSQAVLHTWFNEPEGWMADRTRQHQAIRDDLLTHFRAIEGCASRMPEAGSYLFPQLPPLAIDPTAFVRALRLQAGVIVTPGTEFSPHSGDSIRLNFSQEHAAAVAAVERLTTLLNRYRA